MDDFVEKLISFGLPPEEAKHLATQYRAWHTKFVPEACWQRLQEEYLTTSQPFALHQFLYQHVYAEYLEHDALAPAWFPDDDSVAQANLSNVMRDYNLVSVAQAHNWSVTHYDIFWEWIIASLAIVFQKPYEQICDLSAGVDSLEWLAGAKLNIVDSCFQAAPESTAIIYQAEGSKLQQISYEQLQRDVMQIASALNRQGFTKGAAIAINMPMNYEAVSIYLGIIKAGCTMVAIAESLASEEISNRLKIAHAQAIFTQDIMIRHGKQLALYDKVKAASAPKAIVVSHGHSIELRAGDFLWEDFISGSSVSESAICSPDDAINILFSSGTTGDPKAIPWTHTTAIKCASDAYFHQNIKSGDVLAWPTSLGWMMGPWLIFAALLNRASIALFDGVPTGREFGEFVEEANVTMLGVVPSLVKAWRSSGCMQGLDWSSIKVFSSSGECSNSSDMLYLMYLAGYKPIIEYCGGTEIGGAYITGTVLQPCVPATFSTPAMGSDFKIIDEAGKATEKGEVALLPPAMGLSNRLLNGDHYQVYYANMPHTASDSVLRRHGDEGQALGYGYFRLLGRVDDTMNLSGIKVSSADIERVLTRVPELKECAAIGVQPEEGGPMRLVLYCVLSSSSSGTSTFAENVVDKSAVKEQCQQVIKQHLNPLFNVDDVVIVPKLPRTASNKVMRRALREQSVLNLL